ncbi:MAG: AraC family transcriptional regulator [Casimicrobium sp.]
MHQLLLLTAGGGTVQFEGQRVPLAPLTLVNIAAGDVHAFSFQRGTQGWVTTLADELLGEILAQAGDVRRALGQSFAVTANADTRDVVARIADEFSARSTARALVLRGLAATLLGLVARAAAAAEIVTADLPDSNLLRRFEALLEKEFLNHWSVSDYARVLAVSPTHLSRVTRAATGRAASYLIDERIVREARRNLAYTQLHINTIADTLGFNDAAYFSRVFTRVTGVSPRLFRAQLFASSAQQ